MRKNLSAVNLAGPGLTVRGLNSPQHNLKKVEGFDKSTISQTFTSKIQKIKNRPKNDSLEQEYVKGLQDEIHYLEMELKLLKEKQIAKHSQVDQLETFFGDGIPINQNILALKNGFNNYKSQMDKKILALQAEKRQRQGLISSFRSKITQNSKKIHESQKTHKSNITQLSDITHQKIKQQTLLKQQIQFEQQHLKKIKNENKQIIDMISNLTRTKQLHYVSLMRNENNKYNKLNKIKLTIEEKEKQFQKIGKNYRQLKKQDQDNTYVVLIQENNVKLKKKIISLEKEFNALKIKCADKKLDLQAKLKERLKEINARLDMQTRLDKIKEEIQNQNNMTIQQLQKTAREGQAKILQSILDKNKKLSKYVDFYGDLLYKVEQKLYQHGQRKPDLKRQQQLYQNQIKIAQKQLEGQRQKHCILSSQIAKLKSKSEHIAEIVPPTIEKLKKEEEKIKACKLEREKLLEEIKFKEKQLELMEILKCLSLEEVQISSSSNSSIQDRLQAFMKNFENLNRK